MPGSGWLVPNGPGPFGLPAVFGGGAAAPLVPAVAGAAGGPLVAIGAQMALSLANQAALQAGVQQAVAASRHAAAGTDLANASLDPTGSGDSITTQICEDPDNSATGHWSNNELWSFAGVPGRTELIWGLHRLLTSPNHLCNYPNLGLASGGSPVFQLQDVGPWANLVGESDLDMHVRLHPEFDWDFDFTVPGRVAALDVATSSRAVYWPDTGFSCAALHECFRYTPSSGPPERDGLQDMLFVVSMLPVQWGSG
jgi:hypothetical protein